MEITKDIRYIGVDDHDIDLFEGQYDVSENGMAYNSYVILSDKIAVADSVGAGFVDEWLGNLEAVLDGRTPDYLVVHHMEPDHSAGIAAFMERYPQAQIVASMGAFRMMVNYFGTDYPERKMVVKEGDVLDLGGHSLTFVGAPNVHWPEVIFSYESTDKVPTALASLVLTTSRTRKAGLAKLAATTLASWESSASLCRPCLRRLPIWISRSSARSMVLFLPRIWAITSTPTTPGRAISPRTRASRSPMRACTAI